MSIYIVHLDLIPEGKYFHELTDAEIEQMFETDDTFMIDKYESVDELSAAFNSDEIMYPNNAYMRVVND